MTLVLANTTMSENNSTARAYLYSLLSGFVFFSMTPPGGLAADWSVASLNSLLLDTSGSGISVSEMSGVTYLGPSPAIGKHRFATVQDNGNGIVTFDAAFDLTGNLVSAQAITSQPHGISLDYEGIALVGSSTFLSEAFFLSEALFISEENGPGIRRVDPTTGNQLQQVSIPPIFTNNARSNRGFESLTYGTQGSRLWTANEAAVTVDGNEPTPTSGSTVRLLELNLSGSSVTPGRQYAYEVEPIHGGGGGSARNGLVDLVSLPDGTLLGLERSLATTFPPYRSRIFEISFLDATDVSVAPFDTGLTGKTFTKVSKSLLWSGSAGGGFGQNLEGLTVGLRLPSGEWILLGVVDNGDPLSSNTIVTFAATSPKTILFAADSGDFDQDTDVDGADFLAWQRGFGVTTLAGLNDGDGNHSGTVTGADLAIWKNQYAAAGPLAIQQTVPEPSGLALLLLAGTSHALGSARRRSWQREQKK